MRILVDADACPVKNEILAIGKQKDIQVHLYADVNHRLDEEDAIVHIVDQGADSVDLALINAMEAGDIIITSDYGVASLALARKGYILHPMGKEIHKDNIDQLMFERHIGRETRKKGNRGAKHKKRTKEDDANFYERLLHMVQLYDVK